MTQQLNNTSRSWMLVSLLALLAALVLAAARPLLIDAGPPLIHIRWRPGVAQSERRAIEARLNLRPVRYREAGTWEYEVKDGSASNLEALVRNPAVEDTHYVDRHQFTIEDDAPRPWSRPGRVGRLVPWLARPLAGGGALAFGGLALGAALLARRRDGGAAIAARLVGVVSRGVPALSPFALAAFRLAFGTALALYVAASLYPKGPFPRALHGSLPSFVDNELIHAIAANGEAVRAIQTASIAAAVLFAVGVRPRATYAMAAAGVVLWMLARALRDTAHQFGILLVPLLCLLPVPWGEAPPVHHWSRGSLSTARSKRYGYAPWLLTLALGLAFAAAAWAKLREGPGWVLNGTVKYAFVADGENARVDWGLTIATMPRIAVLMSAAAVTSEAMIIVSAFVRGAGPRMIAGLAGTTLLAGFFLFQGVLWPAWWILLLGFLPWHWLGRGQASSALYTAARLSGTQAACAVALIALQVVVSGRFVEVEPVASRYDMYSTTRSSPAQFDREEPDVRRRVVAIGSDGTHMDITACLSHQTNVLSDLWAAVGGGRRPPTDTLTGCAKGLMASRFRLLEDERAFDWTAGRFYWRYRGRPVAEIAASP